MVSAARKLLVVAAAAAVVALPARSQAEPLVVVARLQGGIFAPTRDFVERTLRRAERAGAVCYILEMNTPGGEGGAMRGIAQLFLNARAPVIVYVAPRGAQAASAGAIISLASHVLAMAPGTTIGAAHPVMGGGANLPRDIRSKVVNDMSAFARTLAEKRGRNMRWAEQIVRASVSVSETEARAQRVAEVLAADRADLLRQVDGRSVTTSAGQQVIRTRGARVDVQEPSWLEALLLFICNPNVAIVLGAVAMYGIITEVSNPGAVVPGVVGLIALVLSLYALSVLTVNAAGIALLIVALVLFAIDVYAPTHGVLTAGGIVASVAGALILFGDPLSSQRVSLSVVIAIAFVNALFFGTVVTAAWRSHRRAPVAGPEALIGVGGEARSAIGAHGSVFVDGSLWGARNVGEDPIEAGDEVIVIARRGLQLDVRRAGSNAEEPGSPA